MCMKRCVRGGRYVAWQSLDASKQKHVVHAPSPPIIISRHTPASFSSFSPSILSLSKNTTKGTNPTQPKNRVQNTDTRVSLSLEGFYFYFLYINKNKNIRCCPQFHIHLPTMSDSGLCLVL